MNKRNWLVFALCSMCAVGAIACSDDSTSGDSIDEESNGDGTATMTVTSSLTMHAGETDSIKVTYKKDGVAADNVKLAVSSTDPACAAPKSDQYTVMEGTADIKVEAKNVTEDCDAKIWILDESTGTKRSSAVHVTAGGGNGGGNGDVVVNAEPKIEFVEPVGCSGTSACSYKADATATSMSVTVKYLDKKGNAVPGTSITVETDDANCVSPKIGSIDTDDNGDARSTLTFKGTNCNAAITFRVDKTEATLVVTRGEATTYYVNFVGNYVNKGEEDANKPGQRIASASSLLYGSLAGGNCPSDEAFESGNFGTLASGGQASVSGKSVNPIFKKSLKIDRTKAEVDGKTSLVGIVYDANDEVIAYGCTPNVTKDAYEGKDVPVFLKEIPVQFHDEYKIISNFDFTSGFWKTSLKEGYPKAESMTAGDWVQFIVRLFKNPVNELLEFIWANTLDRLIGMLGNDGWQGVVKGVLGEGTKQIAIKALEPMIKEQLEKMEWYKCTTMIAVDVADMASNMQLVGTVKAGEFDDMLISGFKTEFNAIQYQVTDNWGMTDRTMTCIDKDDPFSYVAKGVCRHEMSLDSGAVTTSWNGLVKYTPDNASLEADAYLDINDASLDFKWGQVLYTAVFGDILPIVFNYKVDKDNKTGKKLYIKSFLGAIAFQPVVKYYKENKENKPVDGKTVEGGTAGTYPALTISETNSLTGADQSCDRFIEALVYLVWPSVKESLDTFGEAAITTVASFACNEGMGQLDALVMEQIDKLVLSTTNGVTLSSKDCTLFVKDNYYEKMGEPDSSHISANTFLTNQGVANTKRCIWDLNASDDVKINGLFHAIENDL